MDNDNKFCEGVETIDCLIAANQSQWKKSFHFSKANHPDHLLFSPAYSKSRSRALEGGLILAGSLVEAAPAASAAPGHRGRLGGTLPPLADGLGGRVHLVVRLEGRVDAAVALVGARVRFDGGRAHHGEFALAGRVAHPFHVLGDVDHAPEPVVARRQSPSLENPLGEPAKVSGLVKKQVLLNWEQDFRLLFGRATQKLLSKALFLVVRFSFEGRINKQNVKLPSSF